MPEENVDAHRMINLCFGNKEMFKISKYRIIANMTPEYEPFEYFSSMMEQIAESLIDSRTIQYYRWGEFDTFEG